MIVGLTLFVCMWNNRKNKGNMKQLKSTFLLTVLMSMVSICVSASVEVDGIYYNLSSYKKTAEVTYYLAEGVRNTASSSFVGIYSGNVTIPSSITYQGETYTVATIGRQAFYKSNELASVVIPNSVTFIDEGAFESCPNLTTVNIPNGITTISSTTFNGCSSLSSITIPNSVTTIGNSAFYGCSTLTSINIPNNVTTIGSSAFGGCSGLTSVSIPNSVTTIWGHAFRDCSNLTSITIPNSLTTISNYTFWNCSCLLTVTIPNSVTTIEDGAFMDCSNLSSITIPNSVTSIGKDVFNDCGALTRISVDNDNLKYDSRNNCNALIETETNTLLRGCKNTSIPTSVTTIGSNAFRGCSSLTSISIPTSVTTIGSNAFRGCSSLTSISIPNSVTTIGDAAFLDCNSLSSITIPNSVTTIGNYAFSGCSSLTTITIPNSVTSIGSGAFWNCSNLSSAILSNNITSIDSYTFCNCISLASITIPKSVTSIGNWAFDGCQQLTSMTIYHETPPQIGNYIFSKRTYATLYVPAGCKAAYEAADYWKDFKEIIEMAAPSPTIAFADTNVKALCVANWDTNGDGELSEAEAAAVTDLGEVFKSNKTITSFDELQYFTGLTSICDRAFYYCSGLTSITIPNSVTSIGQYAFKSCSGLTSVTIPNSVTSIGNGAFELCSGLNSITIGNSVTSIGRGAFNKCSGLTSIIIPNSVTSIGESAFSSCSSLSSVTIPNNVTSIGYSAFSYCSGLTSVTIGNSVTSIGDYAFSGCSKLTSITIPNSVINIGICAFSSCSDLTSVTIPNSITSIGEGAFRGCDGLISITIPNSVTSIGYQAFAYCDDLTSVTVDLKTPLEIEQNTFSNRTNATLYVPAGCKAAYETANYWKEFKEIIESEVPAEDTDIALLDNTVYANRTEVFTGNEATLSIRMKNTAAIRGFQFDMYLPEGITPMKNSKGRILATLNNDRLEEDDEHTLTSSEQPDGAIRFLCGSQYEETFTGNDGEVFTLKVSVAEDMEDGDYPLLMKNIKLSENNISNYYEVELVKTTLSVSSYTPGDINADGKIDVSDYIGVANHILGHTPEGFVMRAGDVDDSGAIDVSDYLGIGNIIHTGSVYGSNRAMGARASVEPSDLTTMDNVVYVLPETAEPGEDMTLSLCMKNTAAIRGFQFDLYLPEGVTVKKNSKGRILAALNKARLEEDDEHTMTTSEQPDGAIRFLCGSQYEETFTGTDGEVATLQVTIGSDMVAGDYPVILRDMKLSENDIRNFYETEQVVTMLTIPNTTGIGNVHRATSADERYYNLQGQRIEHPKKGLYIKDNRIIIIK